MIFLDDGANQVHHVERSPVNGLVDEEDLALFKVENSVIQILHQNKFAFNLRGNLCEADCQDADYHAVSREVDEFAFLHHVDHPFACEAACDERRQEANYQCHR